MPSPAPRTSPREPSGQCETCRHIEPRLFRYTVDPWNVGYVCTVRGAPLAPHALRCERYEREPGSD